MTFNQWLDVAGGYINTQEHHIVQLISAQADIIENTKWNITKERVFAITALLTQRHINNVYLFHVVVYNSKILNISKFN
ncbi:hypothetical protein [Faecalicatena contorta]|uniref:hypothetical protein n=1 Tax=Faecalicatena contorta TaxID=39482 RepID=UPI0011B25473|nr:hypothetical protein [Faecalicatena contorta]